MNRKQRRMERKLGRLVTQEASPGVQKVFADALRHHQAGRLNEAERLYRQILAVNPRFAEAHNNLGNALSVQGKLNERSHAIAGLSSSSRTMQKRTTILAMRSTTRGS